MKYFYGGDFVLEPFGFLLGVAVFNTAVKFKKPLRKAAIIATSQVMGIMEGLKTTAYELKEEMEDIIAEAHYENMKRNINASDNSDEMSENITQH
jgi:hypothetical protein